MSPFSVNLSLLNKLLPVLLLRRFLFERIKFFRNPYLEIHMMQIIQSQTQFQIQFYIHQQSQWHKSFWVWFTLNQ